jgi:hypothetical protein
MKKKNPSMLNRIVLFQINSVLSSKHDNIHIHTHSSLDSTTHNTILSLYIFCLFERIVGVRGKLLNEKARLSSTGLAGSCKVA